MDIHWTLKLAYLDDVGDEKTSALVDASKPAFLQNAFNYIHTLLLIVMKANAQADFGV